MKNSLPFLYFLLPASLFAHGISESNKKEMVSGGILDYIWLGAEHMVTGYDHLLFLLGVIFFLTKFKDIVKFITVFTLGHSITLIFATFMGITANYFLVDAVIALTVIYKGFDNIDGFKKYLKIESPNLLILVFVFGLIHGFGLSTRLQELPLGTDGLLIKIIAFNVGVELGQIFALSIMLFLLSAWRKTKSFNKFSVFTNLTLIAAGGLLFVYQIGEYVHNPDPSKKNITPVSIHKDGVDTITIDIAPGKGLEYKFDIEQGKELTYEWTTNRGTLFFDFHGDFKNGKGFESYEKNTLSNSQGKKQILFSGSHGWYWKNTSSESIKVTLKTSGNYQILGFN